VTFVECHQLAKSYGDVRAVRDFSAQILPGEILALLGPSGCGKTTVLRLIAGFERLDRGRIVIGPRLTCSAEAHIPPELRQVGMVFQHYALFPHLSIIENVAYGLRGKQRYVQARDMLALVGLSDMEARMPHELSGGQQQRVALARALAPRPAVLLLDEPFSNLDADLRTSIRVQVRAILKHVGTTALFVTHDQEEALFMGDRVAVMNAGYLEQLAEPQALFLAPATRFVAEFIGLASFLPASIMEQGLDTALGFLPQLVSLPHGTPVEVLARPDDLTLNVGAGSNGRIVGRTFRGSEYLYDVLLDSQHMVRCLCNHIDDYALETRVQVRLTPGHALACFPIRHA
jgi:iron(III) transport system ATP-binding protein